MKLMAIIIILVLVTTMATAQQVITDGSPASSTVSLTVIIPEKAKIESVDQQHQILITAEDIRRGYKEISNAASLHVWSNSPDGFFLQHRINRFVNAAGNMAEAVLVLLTVVGTNDPQPVGPEYQYIFQDTKPPANREVVQIALKLVLNQQSKPGIYTLDSDFTVECL